MSEPATPEENPGEEQSLPFAAPCRKLERTAPLRWIALGWRDLKRAPMQSLSYGAIIVVCSYLLAFLAFNFGNLVVLLALVSGFIFVGPILALAFYDISDQLQKGGTPTLGHALQASWRHIGNQMVFAVILMVVFLVWARAASMTHVFFPMRARPELAEMATFLGVGGLVGSLFATFVFCISAFSLPMIIDRKVDTVTAVVTSFNAVLRNKSTMFLWVVLIVSAVAVGMLTAFLGLAVTLPLIGHATWHGYRETIDSSAWPRHPGSREVG
ncbi:MAG: DUF2189 domain-containing protein [Gammaproteobacteria bacterium]|nr:DUF2189 domain-containing protein [Gammaproteobacteria bacterium]MCP5416662.1 DUF2189 domain-containing protein [Chromatiaceae bacterium]